MTDHLSYLVIGAAGQDGTIALEMLGELGIEAHAGIRGPLAAAHPVLSIVDAARVHRLDVSDLDSVKRTIRRIRPTRILNLAGQSSVRDSWERPAETLGTNTTGAMNVLQAVLELGLMDSVRIYQASSSEMFGRPTAAPQDENTPHSPVTPYGVTKSAAHQLSKMLRERTGIWVTNGILYNHESLYRSEAYVVRHVTASVARISMGLQSRLAIGDLAAERDWGYATDYVKGMLQMLEYEHPDDFVLATGVSHSVEDLVRIAFAAVGIDEWRPSVTVESERLRDIEPVRLVGDAGKARKALGWTPSCGFSEMIEMFIEGELDSIQRKKAHPQ